MRPEVFPPRTLLNFPDFASKASSKQWIKGRTLTVARPQAAALSFCLSSASQMLQVSGALAGTEALLRQLRNCDEDNWIEDAKAASRAACRAAPILAESGSQLHGWAGGSASRTPALQLHR